ncbi:helix-turn-helix domain-containing protein [Nonomuraea wenchangensis]
MAESVTDFQSAVRAEVAKCITMSGMSQAQVARTVGITPKHMSQVLTGKAGLSAELAGRIAEACGRDLVIRSRRSQQKPPKAADFKTASP